MLRRKDVMSTITQWQLCTMFFTVLMPLAVESMERLPERERIKPPKDIERPVGKEERVEKYRYAEGKSIQPQQEPMISVGSIEKLQELATTLDKDRAVSIAALDNGIATIVLVEHDQGPWLNTSVNLVSQKSFKMSESRFADSSSNPTQWFLTTMQRSIQNSLRRLSNNVRNIISKLSFGTIAAFNVNEVEKKVNALSDSFKKGIAEFKEAAQHYASVRQDESENKDYQNKRLANAKKALVKSIEKIGDLNFSINEYLDTLNYKIEAGSPVGITPPGKQEERI